MKRALLAVSALLAVAGSGPARAGDLFDAPPAYEPPPAAAPPPAAPYRPFDDFLDAPPAYSRYNVYDWTGLYVGINGGGGWGRNSWASSPDTLEGSNDFQTALLGGTIGYNAHTVSNFVFSEEATIAFSSMSGTIPAPSCVPDCQFRNPWLATAMLRVGYAIDRFMPYVTGGASIGRLSTDMVGAPFGTQSKNVLSWTVGAGVEFVVAGPVTAKIEFLHVDLSGITCDIACGGGPFSATLSENVVRAGLNYRIYQH